jgi:hypothetical protein
MGRKETFLEISMQDLKNLLLPPKGKDTPEYGWPQKLDMSASLSLRGLLGNFKRGPWRIIKRYKCRRGA